ncbi:hypothetical protein CBER1_06173 [Cercospora berteroae]|uniref:Uncharacterized protein n=1 Tax=Cercospora berteroae TaxID=357750 RepID=A0A2S6C4G2_9PEZI|nr:hypothetical protein CBER1_06173 [Cercospora berteroae]
MGCALSSSRTADHSTPPGPSELLSKPRALYYVQRPKKRKLDTPLRAIYRIYWAIVMDDTIVMRNEIEYFWTRKEDSWVLCNIPMPPDQDLERFAVISAIPFALAAAFNRLIDLGLPRDSAKGILTSEELEALAKRPRVYEKVPQWAEEAPPLESPLCLPTEGLGVPQTTEDADPFLLRKNVWVHKLHIYFT